MARSPETETLTERPARIAEDDHSAWWIVAGVLITLAVVEIILELVLIFG